MDRRFFHRLGASQLDRTICSTAGSVGMRMTVGANIGADAEAMPESDLVLLWGTNTLTSNPHLWPFVRKARENGAHGHRIDPHPHAHRGAVRRVDRDPPGHRRRARARHDARAVRRGAAGRRLPRAGTRSAPTQLRERARGVDAGARRRRSPGSPRRRIVALAPRATARAQGGVHPRQLRPAAPRRRRHGGAHHRLPARRHRPLAPRRRRRAALDERELPVQHARRSSGPTCRPPVRDDQHDPARRRAHAARRRRGRPAGAGARRLQLESRRGGARPQRGASRPARATTCSRWCSSTSRPTPPTAPTIVLPATTQLEHWDVHLSYGHHYVTLNRPAIDADRRGAAEHRDLPPTRRRAWGSTTRASRDDDDALIRQALDDDRPEDGGRDVRRAAGARLGAAQPADAVRCRTPTAASRRRAASASSTRSGWRSSGSTRCRRSPRRTSSPSASRSSPRGTRSRSSRRRAPVPELDVRERRLAAAATPSRSASAPRRCGERAASPTA